MRPRLLAGLLGLLAVLAVAGRTSTSVVGAEDPDTATASQDDRRRTLIILLDGFRWDYLNLLGGETSGFKQFLKDGVSAEYVRTVFPSLAFPTWTTISTGVYPETHGILGNYFYNRQRQAAFKANETSTTRKAFWWQRPEPLWTTAHRLGLRVATILWSRSDVPVHGLRPEAAQGYEYISDTLGSLRDSLERSLEYLQRGFDLVMTYSEHVDDVGHRYGPDSLEMKYTIGDVAKLLHGMFRQMEVRDLKDKVNVIVIGDHGMATVDPGEPIRLRQYLDPDQDVEQAMGMDAFISLYAKPGRVEYLYNKLAPVPGLRVWRRGELPAELHFNRNPALPDIIVSAKRGSSMEYDAGQGYLIHGPLRDPKDTERPHGIHGYDPDVEQMRTVFFAVGPDFKRGVKVPPIELVDEYQLFCHVLRIPAQPHNGTWHRVRGLLRGDPPAPHGSRPGDVADDDVEDIAGLGLGLDDMVPTPIRSTELPPHHAAAGRPTTTTAVASFASGPVRIALSVVLGVIGWYLFLCAITN